MGDLSASDNRAIRCLYFNKDLFTQNDIPFPYQSVRDGTWTHEKFFELVSLGGADLNGGGKTKEDEDLYGLYAQGSINANLFYSSGHQFVQKDADGLLTVAFNNAESIDILQHIADTLDLHKSAVLNTDDGNYLKHIADFADNHSYFYAEVMIFIEHMRQYPFNVGIVPMPKYTEEQEHYCQFADGYCSSFAGFSTRFLMNPYRR